MTRIQRSLSGSGASAKSYANSHLYSRLLLNEKLTFVYDLVDTKRNFESLNFVLNAAQKPLRGQLGDDEFQRTYGLPKKLNFKAASVRPAVDLDLWSSIYA